MIMVFRFLHSCHGAEASIHARVASTSGNSAKIGSKFLLFGAFVDDPPLSSLSRSFSGVVAVRLVIVTGAKAIGMTFGPAIGGIFAEPAVNFPSYFPPNGLYARCALILPDMGLFCASS